MNIVVLLIELVKAFIYGIVEGISEWLPISSTGHMLLLHQFVRLQVSTDFWDMFLVVIQLGAILAVVFLFFDKLNPWSSHKTKLEQKSTWRLWAQIVVACIPAAVIGIPLDDWMEERLGSPFVIVAALIVYGIAFIAIEKTRHLRAVELTAYSLKGKHFANAAAQALSQASYAQTDNAQTNDVFAMSWRTALGIGIFQVLSIIPGTSRSGSTIIGGLLLGCSRAVAAEFTFFLAIPVMFGASFLRLVKFFLKGNMFSVDQCAILGVGCVVAFVVSLLTVRFLMRFVKQHDFQLFGIYRIVLGVLVIVYFMLCR